MSLRHRAFVSRQTVFRPSVTSAKDAAGYFVGTDYLCPRNNPPLCILGSNLVVKTSWKEQPELACHFPADRDHRGLDPSNTLDATGVPRVRGKSKNLLYGVQHGQHCQLLAEIGRHLTCPCARKM